MIQRLVGCHNKRQTTNYKRENGVSKPDSFCIVTGLDQGRLLHSTLQITYFAFWHVIEK